MSPAACHTLHHHANASILFSFHFLFWHQSKIPHLLKFIKTVDSAKRHCNALLWLRLISNAAGLLLLTSQTTHCDSTILQASHHRVRLWHATKEIYQDLSDSSLHSDPIHLFPGQQQLYASSGVTYLNIPAVCFRCRLLCMKSRIE